MLLQDHFLLQTEEAYLSQVVFISGPNGVFDSSGAGANQNISHELVEPSPFQVKLVQQNGFFIEDNSLAVILPEFPMLLNLLYLCVHLLLSLYALLYFGHLFIK